jgi:hypothetical protein
MSFPGAVPPAASTKLVLALLLPAAAAASSADDHPYRTQALASTYRYDATHPQPEPAPEPVAVEPPAGRPRKRVVNPAERLPAETPGLTPPVPIGSATLAPNGTLVLPKMSVNVPKPQLPAALPQLYIRGLERNVGPGNIFETPKGRSERLRKKYFSPTEEGLGKLLLNSVGGWAAREEAIYYSSEQLNDLAYLLDLSLAAGTETPEEQKKLRAEYYRLLATKPR